MVRIRAVFFLGILGIVTSLNTASLSGSFNFPAAGLSYLLVTGKQWTVVKNCCVPYGRISPPLIPHIILGLTPCNEHKLYTCDAFGFALDLVLGYFKSHFGLNGWQYTAYIGTCLVTYRSPSTVSSERSNKFLRCCSYASQKSFPKRGNLLTQNFFTEVNEPSKYLYSNFQTLKVLNTHGLFSFSDRDLEAPEFWQCR